MNESLKPLPSQYLITPKITVSASLLSSLVHVLRWGLGLMRLHQSSFVYVKKEQPIFIGWALVPPVDYDTQSCSLIQRCVKVIFDIFLIGRISVQYQTLGLLYICAHVTDVTKYSLLRAHKPVTKTLICLFSFIYRRHFYLCMGSSSFLTEILDPGCLVITSFHPASSGVRH